MLHQSELNGRIHRNIAESPNVRVFLYMLLSSMGALMKVQRV